MFSGKQKSVCCILVADFVVDISICLLWMKVVVFYGALMSRLLARYEGRGEYEYVWEGMKMCVYVLCIIVLVATDKICTGVCVCCKRVGELCMGEKVLTFAGW